MPRLACWLLLLSACPLARGAEWYVSPAGSDSNPGTLAQPFGSIERGQQAASAGDTVWLRGGVYEYSGTTGSQHAVLFNKSGTTRGKIKYWAYADETPVFDFFNYQPYERIRGFSVQADNLHFRGLELRGVQQVITNVNESWGIRVENRADNNIFEELNLHHNEGPGLFIADGGNNLILNSDSHNNYDPDRGGENADGFGVHSNDAGNRIVGSRAWNNSDDGYDFINADAAVSIEDSWAWGNGYIPGTTTAAGNGAGFKVGGYGLDSGDFPGTIPRNTVAGNLAFDNRVQGFYSNHHPGGIDWLHNTSIGNARGFDLLNDVDPENWPADHFLRNNLAYGNNTNLANANQSQIDDEHNSWNTRGATSGDFVSLSRAGVDGPRQADGSLPEIDFARLLAGSGLIDAGADLGDPFYGLAPDLGAFESGMPGDFDGDGFVDAADYVVWRNQLGVTLDPSHYFEWADNYGATAESTTVPEPSVLALLGAACVGLGSRRRAG